MEGESGSPLGRMGKQYRRCFYGRTIGDGIVHKQESHDHVQCRVQTNVVLVI